MSAIRRALEWSPYLEVGVRQLYWGSPILPTLVTRASAMRAKHSKATKAPSASTDIDRVIESLRELGVRAGDLVLLHSGFRAIRGGGKSPDQVLDALLDLVGPTGTLCTPSIPFWPEAPKLYERMVADVSNVVFDYDPATTPAWTGAIPNAMIRRPSAVRSKHPLNTMVAIGPLAESMVAHDLDGERPFPNGPTSSWQFCFDHDAWVVCVGADMAHSLTMIHLVEDVEGTDWPVRGWYRDRRFRIKIDGQWQERTVRERHPKWAKHYAERTLSRDLHRTGICSQTAIDGVNLEVLRAKEMVGYLRQRNDDLYPYFLIPDALRKPPQPPEPTLRAVAAHELPDTRALAQSASTLLVSRGRDLIEVNLASGVAHHLATLPKRRWRGRLAAGNQRRARLLRVDTTLGHALGPSSWLVGDRDALYVVKPGSIEQTELPDGARPFKLSTVAGIEGFEDRLVFGDYCHNPLKSAVSIRGQRLAGGPWEVLHTFASGEVNHIHAVVPDPHRDVCWILTGDYGEAAAIWRATDDFRQVEPVLRGSQIHRSCVLFPMKEGLLYATDSHLRANSIRWADEDSRGWRSETVHALAGSCLFGAPWGDQWAFTTTVEPGEPTGFRPLDYLDPRAGPGITGRGPHLVAGRRETGFEQLLSVPVRPSPRRLLGFSSLSLPAVSEPSAYLAVSHVGLGSEDRTVIYRLETS